MDVFVRMDNLQNSLLLNAGYEPLRVVSWERAFVLVFQQKVEILEEYGHSVRTVSRVYPIPAVIRLRNWVNLKRRVPVIRFSRANLYTRDDYRCQYCYKHYPTRELTLDHIIPVSRGGKKNWENIVTACLRCNQRKGHRSPEDVGMKLKKKPVVPRWLPTMVGAIRAKKPPEIWAPYLGNYPLRKLQKGP